LGAELALEGLNVADEAELSVLGGLEAAEGLDDDLDGVGVEGAEALVEEEGLDGHRHARAVGQAKGEGQGHDEGLAAGQGGDGADIVGLIAVLHCELGGRGVGGVGDADEAVTLVEHGEPRVGVRDEQREGDALGEVSKRLAFFRPDEVIEELPAVVLGALVVEGGGELGVAVAQGDAAGALGLEGARALLERRERALEGEGEGVEPL
jgi:hypothetical protein